MSAEFKERGKWGMRDGWTRNWTWLADVKRASLATLKCIEAGDPTKAELYATHLANLAHRYLKSGRVWRVDTKFGVSAPASIVSPGSGMSIAMAVFWLMKHEWTLMQPGEKLTRTHAMEERQCGKCLEWKSSLMTYLTTRQRIALCEACK